MTDHDSKRATYVKALMRNRFAVMKVAKENFCVERVNISPLYLLPRMRCSPEKIDEKLNKALDDKARSKDGVKYPFEDIVGEDYFPTIMGLIRRDPNVGSIRMIKRNSFLNHEVILYFTGILRDGVFVDREGVADISVQLRKSTDPQQDIWCVPLGFVDDLKELNGLFNITGPFCEGEFNPQGLAIRINSEVGRLQMLPGKSLTFDEGNGGLFFKEECDVEIPQICGTVPAELTTTDSEKFERPPRDRKQPDRTLGVATSLGAPGKKAGGGKAAPRNSSESCGTESTATKLRRVAPEFDNVEEPVEEVSFDAIMTTEIPQRTAGRTREDPIVVRNTQTIVDLEVHGFCISILDDTRPHGKRTTQGIRKCISTKGNSFFGDRYFTLLAGKAADYSLGFHHILCSDTPKELPNPSTSISLDIYHNTTQFDVQLEFYRDSHRIFSIFREIEGRTQFMRNTKDFIEVSSMPLSALHSFVPSRVTVPSDYILLLKSDILRKFIYPRNCTASMDRYGAALSTSPVDGEGRLRGRFYPSQEQTTLEPILSIDTCSDMYLQFHCRETCLPPSSQLHMLFSNKALLRGSVEFMSSKEHCLSKDIFTLLRNEPHSIVSQEAVRHTLIEHCVRAESRDRSLGTFEVRDIFGLSYWTLKKLFEFWPRFEVLPGVSDDILRFFMTRIALEPPEIRDKHEAQMGKFVTSYMALARTAEDQQGIFHKLVEQQRKWKPHLVGWEVLHRNDYKTLAGGFTSFCSKINFQTDQEFTKCGCLYFCRQDCTNVKAEIECCEKTCTFAYNCLNRPTFSTVRPPFEVLRTTNGTNFGVYATQYFPPGVFIMEYIGVISIERPDGDQSYVLECSKGSKYWYINAIAGGSIARFVNHSCEPNSIMVGFNDYSHMDHPWKMFLKSSVGIEKGAELTFRYSSKALKFKCLCGSLACISRQAASPPVDVAKKPVAMTPVLALFPP